MFSSQRVLFAACLLSITVTGCGQSATSSESQLHPAAPEQCGNQVTTLRRSMNGRALQGISMTSGTVTKITKDCVEIADLHLDGTALVGSLADKPMRGTDFLGTTVTQVDQSGTSIIAAITAIDVDPRDVSGETLLYTLKAQTPSDGQLIELCAPDLDGVRRAIPVPGTWDASGAHSSSTRFTFGCTSAAIGKCVRLGYRPWTRYLGTSLEGYHQACTRMVRFDYCGDGQSHTEDGTEIDAYDLLKLNTKDSALLNPFDGAWSEDGAYCIERQRWIRLSVLDGFSLQALLPSSCLNKFEPALSESSPIDPADLCQVRSKSVRRDSVKMDNRSGVNILLR